MNIQCIKTGFLEENCYILKKGNTYLVIDPGDDFFKLKNFIDGKVLGILITHRHFDHIGAVEDMVREYQVLVYEKRNLQEGNYKIGDFCFRVIFTPGHSKDSVSYYFYEQEIMFTGDFLFYNDIGRCDLDGGSFEEMKLSIEKMKKFDHDIIIYPGHGKKTNLSFEKEKNIYFNS